jgi:hypothetical protein
MEPKFPLVAVPGRDPTTIFCSWDVAHSSAVELDDEFSFCSNFAKYVFNSYYALSALSMMFSLKAAISVSCESFLLILANDI